MPDEQPVADDLATSLGYPYESFSGDMQDYDEAGRVTIETVGTVGSGRDRLGPFAVWSGHRAEAAQVASELQQVPWPHEFKPEFQQNMIFMDRVRDKIRSWANVGLYPERYGLAKENMAGRPGRLGLPRYEGPRPEGYAKFGKKDLRDMASSGDQLAAMELEWRKQDKALRAGMIVPERVAKRPAQPPQVTAFAPGFSAVPAVSDRGQQVFRILLHGQPIPTEKMPEGRFSLSMEGAAAMSHKLDPQTGERLRFGKTKSQRRGSKAAANPWWQE